MVIAIIRKQGRERKGLNNFCKFFWMSLLELGLGVTNTLLPESKEVYLSIRIMVRVRITIDRWREIKDWKIDLREVG